MSELLFEAILVKLCREHEGVAAGKMMTAPAIKYKGKVFAFYHKNAMTFKLGKGRDLKEEFGVEQYSFLSPFKNKPPMKAWYIISETYEKQWEILAVKALSLMQ